MNGILHQAAFAVQVSGGQNDRCVFAVRYITIPAFGGLPPAPDCSAALPKTGGFQVKMRIKRRIGCYSPMKATVTATFIGNDLSENPVNPYAVAPPAVWEELKRLYLDLPSDSERGSEPIVFVDQEGRPIRDLNRPSIVAV